MPEQLRVFVDALHGEERPIGRVFISYAREDKTVVENTVLDSLATRGIPFFIDESDMGVTKTVERIVDLVDDSACGIVILSEASLTSPWVWFEIGLLEGKGKRVLPFSLVPPDRSEEFLRGLPDFIRQYNIASKVSDLIPCVREETFIAGQLASRAGIRDDIFSELRQVNVEVTIDEVPRHLRPLLEFSYLLVKFGRDGQEDLMEEHRRDAVLVNVPVPAARQSADAVSQELRASFTIPVHKILGAQIKFFVDVRDMGSVEEVAELLTARGALQVTRSESGEQQRLYFLVDHQALPQYRTPDDKANHFIYPA